MIELTFRRKPVDETYQPLPTNKFIARGYLIWRVEPEPAAGEALNAVVAGILADSFRAYHVLSTDRPANGGKFWLLFAADVDISKIPAITNDELDELAGLKGFVRTMPDCTFAEVGLASEELMAEWFRAVRALAHERL